MSSLRITNQRGDTIIEVLISLAVLAFALVTSYGIMNQSLVTARNVQEHSEALEYLNSQVELLRAANSNPALFSQTIGDPFCMFGIIITQSPDPVCNVGDDSRYVLSIVRSETNVFGERQNIFTFTVDWTGPGSTGPQKEVLSYKLYEVNP